MEIHTKVKDSLTFVRAVRKGDGSASPVAPHTKVKDSLTFVRNPRTPTLPGRAVARAAAVALTGGSLRSLRGGMRLRGEAFPAVRGILPSLAVDGATTLTDGRVFFVLGRDGSQQAFVYGLDNRWEPVTVNVLTVEASLGTTEVVPMRPL